MKCMKCKENEANVYITKSINGKVKKECLCERCAGIVHSKQMMNMDKMFAKMFSPSHTFDMFNFRMPRLNDSFFGAFETQDTFFDNMFRDFDNMNNLVIKIKGPDRCKSEPEDTVRTIKEDVDEKKEHIDNNAKNIQKNKKVSLEDLKKQLEIAVKEERYEDAAVLRDKINGYNE